MEFMSVSEELPCEDKSEDDAESRFSDGTESL